MAAEKRQSLFAGGAKSRRMAWVLIAAMLWLNLLFFLDFRKGMQRGYTDFTVYYTGATILREGRGHQIYSRQVQYEVQEGFTGHIPFRRGPLPYIHPPFEALVFVPLTLLPYSQAFLVWDLLTVGMLFAVTALLRRSVVTLRSIPLWQFVIAALSFFPVFSCLLQGQDSVLQLLLCLLGFNALNRKADLLGGGWLALAAFKFQFIVPLMLLLFLWKRWRSAIGFAAVAALLALVSIALSGMESLLHYPRYVLEIVRNAGLGGVPPELLPNLHGLAMGWPPPFSGVVGIALALLISVVLFLFAVRTGWNSEAPDAFELQFSLAIVVSVLIAWQTNLHDLCLLILPLILVTDYCIRSRPRTPALRSAILLPALPVLISPLWMALWLVAAKVNLMAIPLLWWAWKIGGEISGRPKSLTDASSQHGIPWQEHSAANEK
jgi:hypothetical protein